MTLTRSTSRSSPPFADRADAGRQLADELRRELWVDPLVLAIPRGGIETALPIAEVLGAELDCVFARKLRSPHQRELAFGAIDERGVVHLDRSIVHSLGLTEPVIEAERRRQLAEIERRAALVRARRPRARIAGRDVIVTDDGIATGSTMLAALETVRREHPRSLTVAVPVAPPDRLEEARHHADRVVCLHAPTDFWAVGQFYDDFREVRDERVVEVMERFGGAR